MNDNNKIISIIKSKCDLNTIKQEYDSIAVIGPTASGKSDIALYLAKYLEIPIVNMDSQQFFKNYPILTCSPMDTNNIEHRLYNFLDDNEKFSLGRWIETISKMKNKLLVGGSMFFLFCLQSGFPMVKISKETSIMVDKIANKYEYLNSIYPRHNLHPNNLYRIDRLLKFYLETGYDFTNYPDKYSEKIFVIWLDRKNLLDNIVQRTNNIFDRAISEVQQHKYNNNVKSIIGYEDIWDHINGKKNREQSINDIIVKTYQYAKYQRKWRKKLNINLYINL